MKNPASKFRPIVVAKRAKKFGGGGRRTRSARRVDSIDGEHELPENGEDIANEDHKEFPFSHRDGYPKLGVEDALAPSKSGGKYATRSVLTQRQSS